MKTASITSLVLAAIFGCQAFTFAQNPLRAAPDSPQQYPVQQVDYQTEDNRVLSGILGESQHQPASHQSPVDDRSSVVLAAQPATHVEPPRMESSANGEPISRIPMRSSEIQDAQSRARHAASQPDTKLPGNQNLFDFIGKLALNLVFILSFAAGILLIARRWINPNSNSQSTRHDEDPIDALRIRETLRLDAKTTIRLVQWRSNRFMVACDHNGIQSVNPLNPSFDQTLGEMEDVEDSQLDNRIIRSLLTELDGNKKAGPRKAA